MDIVFYTRGLAFTGNTLEEKSLGGSETALIQLSRTFAKLGHEVTVYCECSQEGIFNNVTYLDFKKLDDFVKVDECDIFITSRFYDILGTAISAKIRILWNHDILVEADKLFSVIYGIDYMYCLSKFHVKQYLEKLPELKPIIKQTHNGIDFSLMPPDLSNIQKQHMIMFTSRPERGLYHALEYYEVLGDKSLEFHFCNYKTVNDPNVTKIENLCLEKVNELNKKGFKVTMGRYIKQDLYPKIASAKAVIYPTEFPEISCISAMEAQACGTVFISTHDYALEETVAYKGIVPGDGYPDRFLKRLEKVLSDEKYRKELEAEGLEHVKQYTWDNVAKTFLDDAKEYLTERSKDVNGVIDQLIYESDLFAAREIAKVKAPDRVAELDHMLRFVDGTDDIQKIYEMESTHEDLEIQNLNSNKRFNWAAERIGVAKPSVVLDYACHMGHGSILMGLTNKNTKVIGYDISQKAINKARERQDKFYPESKDNVAFASQDEHPEKFPERSVDGLFCGEFLEHIPEPEAFVDYLESLVKPGGKIWLTLPRGAWEWLSREDNKRNDVYFHVNHFTKHDVVKMFSQKKDFKINVLDMGNGFCGEFIGNYLIEYSIPLEGELNPPTPKRDFDRKLFWTRPYQSISACMIVKNAEATIESTIKSFKKEVDEIIIVDDGSTDDTVIRAEKLGAKVIKNPKSICAPDWDGFANARNRSIEPAKGKWIFWIDSDERAFNFQHLRRYLNSTLLQAFVVKQHHSQLDTFTKADSPQRLFRKEFGVFSGYIHEQVQSIENINKPLFPALIMADARIVNYGMETEDVRRNKELNRNHPLLLKDMEKNPDRKLNKVFFMREYINQIKWEAERNIFKSLNSCLHERN